MRVLGVQARGRVRLSPKETLEAVWGSQTASAAFAPGERLAKESTPRRIVEDKEKPFTNGERAGKSRKQTHRHEKREDSTRQGLRADREVVLALLPRTGNCAGSSSANTEELRADRACVLVDREIVLAPDALRLAAEELREDHAYVLAAVQTQTLLCCADLPLPAMISSHSLP